MLLKYEYAGCITFMLASIILVHTCRELRHGTHLLTLEMMCAVVCRARPIQR